MSSGPHLICLSGFDATETATFESFFHLAARSEPGYALISEVARADLVVVDGNAARAKELVLEAGDLLRRVLVIGDSPEIAEAGYPVHLRPIRFMAVLGMIDKLLSQSPPTRRRPISAPRPAPLPAPVARPAAGRVEFAATQPMSGLLLQQFTSTDYNTTQPFMRPPAPPPVFATTQPFAPLEMQRAAAAPGTDDETDNEGGFAATRPFTTGLEPLPSAAPWVAPARVAPREDLITADSLASFKRPSPPNAPVPVAIAAAAPAMAAAAPVPTSKSEPPTAGYERVLVVDDGKAGAKFLRTRLGLLGFEVSKVRTTQEALAALATAQFVHVFIDIAARESSPRDACRAIKNEAKRLGYTPTLIMISASGGLISRWLARWAGANAYLTKPVQEPALLAVLAHYERRTRSSRSFSR